MSTPKTFAVMTGPSKGLRLRVREGALEIRPIGEASYIVHRPLRSLAKEYPADSDVWEWLRAHGYTRPSPSGTRSRTTNADRRARGGKRIEVWLSEDDAILLESLSTEIGNTEGLGRSATLAKTIVEALHALNREMTEECELDSQTHQSSEGDR